MGRRKKGSGVDPRNRKSLQVQMDLGKSKERELAEYYEETKKSGAWKSDFINAMRLYLSLRNDSLKVLAAMYPELVHAWELYNGIKSSNYEAFKELFPEMYQRMRLEMREEVVLSTAHKHQGEILQEIREMKAKLDGMKSVQTAGLPQGSAGIKPIGAAPIAAPNFDDDEDLVLTTKKDEGAGLKASENFIRSMMGLQK